VRGRRAAAASVPRRRGTGSTDRCRPAARLRRSTVAAQLRRRDGVAEIRAAEVAVSLAQRGERVGEPGAAPDRREQARPIRERDEPHAIARPGFESREQGPRGGEFGGEHAVVEIGVAQPLGEARREVGFREQACEQCRAGAAARAVAVHVPTRRQRRAGGDVDHDHELVDACTARRGSSTHFDERRCRRLRAAGVDAQPAGVVRVGCFRGRERNQRPDMARASGAPAESSPRARSAMLPRDA
jgi:hypothetical protein